MLGYVGSVGRVLSPSPPRLSPFLLDKISVPSAASVSLARKLRGGHPGQAFRVRRNSNNDEADIGFTPSGLTDETALLEFVRAGNLLAGTAPTFSNSLTTTSDVFQGARRFTLTETGTGIKRAIFTGLSPTSSVRAVSLWVARGSGARHVLIGLKVSATVGHELVVNLDTGAVLVNSGTSFTTTNYARTIDGVAGRQITLMDAAVVPGYVGTFYVDMLSVSSWPSWQRSYVGDGTSSLIVRDLQVHDGSVPSGFITTLYDQSGFGRNATQSSPTAQMAAVVAGVPVTTNGRLGAQFSGISIASYATPAFSPGGATAFTGNFVAPVIGSAIRAITWSADTGTEWVRYHIDGASYPQLGRTARTGPVAAGIPSSGGLVHTAVNNGTNHKIYSNGSLAATAALSGALDTSTRALTLGSTTPSTPMSGQVQAEYTLFTGELSGADLQALHRDQGSFYGIGVA